MRPLRTFTVEPALPEVLLPLRDLAYNLWWTWNADAQALLLRLDANLWEEVAHNPVALLGRLEQSRIQALAEDEGFLAHLQRVREALAEYIRRPGWWTNRYGRSEQPQIAYFCAEFGISECLPIYSGGLGVLAGDHLKSASDLDLPLVAMGLMYQQGYFRQRLNADGWQLELYPRNDFHNMPVSLVRGADGKPVMIRVEYPGRDVHAQVWCAQVGRVRLFLLDTNVSENSPEDRQITSQLYGGDQEMRIRQEIMLGIGGVRALTAMGVQPKAFHMNEGHSAFLGLERCRVLMEQHHISFAEARQAVVASSIFTTHTPVPAGNDAFEPWLIDRYFEHFWPRLGLSREQFLALGRQDPENNDEPMNLTVLALHMSRGRNGVSALHGAVSRRLWHNVWPALPLDEVPIQSITNGIHTRSWISHDLADLYDRYLGPRWAEKPGDPEVWKRVEQIPDTELWRSHERRRERMVAFVRRRLREQCIKRGASQSELRAADEVLDPEALTIGFARRFATYKRASLILEDMDRLTKILNDPNRRVQIVFAGKAHPRDNPGKELIRRIIHSARAPELRRGLVFLEDYDINVARYLVQGVDIWLNTPLRPMEASGTSGMKAAANGVMNCSVLDGWWAEGYRPDVGWAVGSGETYDNLEYQNRVESQALYDLLEKELVPLFYDRGPDGLPREWIRRMKACVRNLAPVFTTNRMVREYGERFYAPAIGMWEQLTGEALTKSKELAGWTSRIFQRFPQVRIEGVTDDISGASAVGRPVTVRASVQLGELPPDDVAVQLYYGTLDSDSQLRNGAYVDMKCEGPAGGKGSYAYTAQVQFAQSGLTGYTVRILPRHGEIIDGRELSLVRWA